jgi:hypothetical protein
MSFWTLPIHHPVLYRTQRLRNWVCLCPQVKGWEALTLLDLLE